MRKGLGSSLVVVFALLLLTAGVIAGGSFGGSWNARLRTVNPEFVELIQEREGSNDQQLSPFSESSPNLSFAPKSRVAGCPAPCTGTVLFFSGNASGIGGAGGTVNVEGAGYPIVTCFNPSGEPGNDPPGANRELIIGFGTDGFGSDEIDRRGKLPISFLGTDPSSMGIGEPLPNPENFCPSANWTAMITSVLWIEGKIYLVQNGEQTLCEITVFEGSGGTLSC